MTGNTPRAGFDLIILRRGKARHQTVNRLTHLTKPSYRPGNLIIAPLVSDLSPASWLTSKAGIWRAAT